VNRARLAAALRPHLELLYPEQPQEVADRLVTRAEQHVRTASPAGERPTERTAFLITYGDAIRRAGQAPLATLKEVLDETVRDALTDVHLLPLYPWTSDDGFAVVDHRRIDESLGTWDDVSTLGEDRGVLLDFVANHVSSRSPWFQGWLAGDPQYAGYFLSPGPDFDTTQVVRPRATPLLHEYDRPDGSATRAWTTFGPDQVDVNVATPEVLLDLTDVLLGYLARGATAIRLDAIGFLAKRSGTSCMHLPQTHAVIKIWRALLEEVAPGTVLLTETNVPHAENISYFGDGTDEAHMVYQFALPPLVLHAFATGSVSVLSRWAAEIGPVSDSATWFNFLASHDGIGMRPTEGLLTDEDRTMLVQRALAHGGRAAMVTRPDGSEAPYELNVSYLDMLADPDRADDAEVARRALAAHSILLSMVGVPAIYYHSLFGSTHDIDGMAASGIPRRINRKTLDAETLLDELQTSLRRRSIFDGLTAMLLVRREEPAFSPFAAQEVVALDDRVLALRRAGGTPHEILSLTNVSADPVELIGLEGTDVLTGRSHSGAVVLPAHGVAWLRDTTSADVDVVDLIGDRVVRGHAHP
jgi:glucosylglycerate phosphorylase